MIVNSYKKFKLIQKLFQNAGIQLDFFWKPLHLQKPAKAMGYDEKDFPVTMSLAKRILSLPLYPEMTDQQQDYIVSLFEKFFLKHKK